MSATKTIQIALPQAMGKEIAKIAREEHQTVTEIIRESFRQYRARKNLYKLAKEAAKAVKAKKLTVEDFGGPFEE